MLWLFLVSPRHVSVICRFSGQDKRFPGPSSQFTEWVQAHGVLSPRGPQRRLGERLSENVKDVNFKKHGWSYTFWDKLDLLMRIRWTMEPYCRCGTESIFQQISNLPRAFWVELNSFSEMILIRKNFTNLVYFYSEIEDEITKNIDVWPISKIRSYSHFGSNRKWVKKSNGIKNCGIKLHIFPILTFCIEKLTLQGEPRLETPSIYWNI